MADIATILGLIKIIVFGFSIILAIAYTLLILLIRRFQNRLNILTVNICISIALSSIYWIGYFIMWQYYIEYLFTQFTCTFIFYIQAISVCEMPFTLVALSVNRFCAIVYSTKPLFKTNMFMIICIVSQWIAVCLVSLPFLVAMQPYCIAPRWMWFYLVVVAEVVPALITLIVNLGIFKHARYSSRRIHPQQMSAFVSVTKGGQQPKINRRDLHLLRHTIFMFSIFAIGWTPIFLLVAIDYNGDVSPLVYTILQILADIATLTCIFNLFLYNHELTKYLKKNLLHVFNVL